MPTWTAAKWRTRTGSVMDVGAALLWAVDRWAFHPQQAQAEEELPAMVDDLLQHVPQDPSEHRRAVPRHLHDAVEVIHVDGGQVGHRFLVGALELRPKRLYVVPQKVFV